MAGGTVMNTKSLMMLGLAVAFGLIAMVLTRQMLAQEPAKAEEAQDVLVAARDLKEEEMLKPDVVKVIRMAKSAVPVGAFSSPKDVEERWVKTAMLEGDVVIEKKLGPKGTPPGLVANIPMGMRAFAIDVTEQSGVSGFILPGHRVDVIRYENDRAGQRAERILQNILVLASGQVFTRAEERSLTNRTVTLALTPDQVDIMVAARAKGQLSLALRGVNDHEVVARPKPKPAVDDAAEQRRKLEEQRRTQLEQELRQVKEALGQVKEALAKKAAEPPPPPAPAPPPPPAPRAMPRYATIYRGIDQVQRVRTDVAAVAELVSRPEAIRKSEATSPAGPLGFRLAPEESTDDSGDP
jgi:pilus assembly protein CpaB